MKVLSTGDFCIHFRGAGAANAAACAPSPAASPASSPPTRPSTPAAPGAADWPGRSFPHRGCLFGRPSSSPPHCGRESFLFRFNLGARVSHALQRNAGEKEPSGSGDGSRRVFAKPRSQFQGGKLKLNGRCPALGRLQTPFFFSALPPLKTQQAPDLRQANGGQRRLYRK